MKRDYLIFVHTIYIYIDTFHTCVRSYAATTRDENLFVGEFEAAYKHVLLNAPCCLLRARQYKKCPQSMIRHETNTLSQSKKNRCNGTVMHE